MCDSLVILPPLTANGSIILAKNSDREPDEAQAIVHEKRRKQQSDQLKCTFIQIPQVAETYEVILSKPFQMWGAEMGVNEWGVAIANEAVFTRIGIRKKNNGLTGMDLLRLALERAKNALEAVGTITALLEHYGQDACGGYKNKNFYYHNSFLITDSEKAYILDTAGRSWAYKEVSDRATISNVLNIGVDDEKRKIIDKPTSFFPFRSQTQHFADYYSDLLMTTLGRARQRRACTLADITSRNADFAVVDAMNSLKRHHLSAAFEPKKASTADVCMHSTGMLNPSSTTGSMVAVLRRNGPHTIWLTAAPHPCMSVYIPFYFETDTISKLQVPGATADGSLWWRYKNFQANICRNYKTLHPPLASEINSIQNGFLEQERQLMNRDPNPKDLERFSQECLNQVLQWLS
jgi:dipeptidase